MICVVYFRHFYHGHLFSSVSMSRSDVKTKLISFSLISHSSETGRQSSDLTGIVDRCQLLSGSAQENRAVWCPVGSQKQPTLLHTWVEVQALPLLGPLPWGHKQRRRERGQEIEGRDKHTPSSQPDSALDQGLSWALWGCSMRPPGSSLPHLEELMIRHPRIFSESSGQRK